MTERKKIPRLFVKKMTSPIVGTTLVLTSSDPDIKQAFFSWGSWGTGLRIKEHPEYYGRDTEPAVPNPDYHLWEWKLSPESAQDLIGLTEASLADPAHYRMSPAEIKASEEVLKVIRRALEDT